MTSKTKKEQVFESILPISLTENKSMKNSRSTVFWLRSYFLLLTCLVFVYTFFFTSTTSVFVQSLHQQKLYAEISNQTLGFGKIYTVSLPERYTKRDEIFFIGHATNLTFSDIEGIRGDTIGHENLPYLVNPNLTDPQIGCWRSHLNTWRKFIEDGVETALILEDDVDFSVSIRQQLNSLQSALSRIQNQTEGERAYSGDWDLLWLGACGERTNKQPESYILYSDKTSPGWNDIYPFFQKHLLSYGFDANSTLNGSQRMIQQSQYPLCTVGYAISRKAAIWLYFQATRYLQEPIDNFMAGRSDIKAYTVVPPLFSQYRIQNKHNSDIQSSNQKLSGFFNPSVGHAYNIRQGKSIRSQLPILLRKL